ncbi:MAG: hypothetical protein ACOC3V_03880, partial [bacterium]
VEYKNMKTKIKIICPQHGIFEQTPDNHLNKIQNCPKCNSDKISNERKKPQEKFIIESNKIHNNKYDYSLVEYKNMKTKIKIICPQHGIFEQKAYNHNIGIGCPTCSKNKKLTNEEFILKSNEIHGGKYNYSLIDYKNAHTKVKIICNTHNIFEQSPQSHLNGRGCPSCYKSKGEDVIMEYLVNNKIVFNFQKTFNDCCDKRKLKFDFYLPKYNICIEYDGEQHYRVVNRFGGEKGFINRQRKDKIKNNYCKENNIYLLRIKYNDNIVDILDKIIN